MATATKRTLASASKAWSNTLTAEVKDVLNDPLFEAILGLNIKMRRFEGKQVGSTLLRHVPSTYEKHTEHTDVPRVRIDIRLLDKIRDQYKNYIKGVTNAVEEITGIAERERWTLGKFDRAMSFVKKDVALHAHELEKRLLHYNEATESIKNYDALVGKAFQLYGDIEMIVNSTSDTTTHIVNFAFQDLLRKQQSD